VTTPPSKGLVVELYLIYFGLAQSFVFYYYGRLRDSDVDSSDTIGGDSPIDGEEWHWPFVIHYLTHPRLLAQKVKKRVVGNVRRYLRLTKHIQQMVMVLGTKKSHNDEHEPASVPVSSPTTSNSKEDDDAPKSHSATTRPTSIGTSPGSNTNFEMAAFYYRKAIESHSARGHFNLGFMYEWGLGLGNANGNHGNHAKYNKPDFHLAKRHYDHAATHHKEAELAVSMALQFMHLHEFVVKKHTLLMDITARKVGELKLDEDGNGNAHADYDYYTLWEMATSLLEHLIFGSSLESTKKQLQKQDVYMTHLLSAETVLLYVFVWLFGWLLVRLVVQTRRKIIMTESQA
jgi:TPR repeat protein